MFAYGCSIVGLERPEFLFKHSERASPKISFSFGAAPTSVHQFPTSLSTSTTNNDGMIVRSPLGNHVQILSDTLNVSSLIYPDFLKALHLSLKDQSDALLHGSAFSYREKTYLILGDRNVGKSSTLIKLSRHSLIQPICDDLIRIDKGSVILGAPYICAHDPVELCREAKSCNFSKVTSVFLLRRGNPSLSKSLPSKNLRYELTRASTIPIISEEWFEDTKLMALFGNNIDEIEALILNQLDG